MTYNDDYTWHQLAQDAGQISAQLKNILLSGIEKYNEWQSFRAGRDNTTIAAALTITSGATITVAMVADLDACYAALEELYDYANNDLSPSSGDRLYAMRKFS